MDIANLGISIDPQRAVEGSRRVRQALNEVGDSARRNLGDVDRQSTQAGNAVQRLGQRSRRGFADMVGGITQGLDAFGLMNGAMGGLIRRTENLLRTGDRMTRTFRDGREGARSNADAINGLGGAMNGTNVAAGTMRTGIAGMLGTVLVLTTAVLSLVAGLGLLAIGLKAIGASIPEAAALEAYEVRLAVAMGSFTEAREKLYELNQFADETPFTDSEVFNAGVKLQAMTKGALSSKEALMGIGGAAVVAGKSFDEMADLAGRTYNMIQLGMDYIEPLKTMFSYGLIDGKTVQQVVQLGDEAKAAGDKGKNAAAQWALIYEDLQKKAVALTLQSRTWNGLISTISGKWDQVKASFGEPIMDALKPLLEDIIRMLPLLADWAGKIGDTIGAGLRILIEAIQSGTLSDLLATTMMAGLETVVDGFTTMWASGTIYWGNMLGDAMGSGVEALATMLDTTFTLAGDWLGNSLGEGADVAANALMKAYASVVEWLSKEINKILVPASAAAVQLGLKDNISIIGPTAGYKPQNFFEPGEKRTFAEQYAITNAQGKYDFMPNDLSEEDAAAQGARMSQGLVGTTWRDRAGEMSAKLHTDSLLKNPGFSDSDLGDLTGGGGGLGLETPGEDGGKGGSKKALDEAKEFKTQMEEMLTAWQDLAGQIDSGLVGIGQSIAGNMTEAITGLINGTKTAKQAFGDMAASIINDIIRIVIQMTIQLAIAKALGAMGYTGQMFSFATAHSGGTVGDLNQTRMPKFHQGGTLTSEQVVKVDRGETILTRRRAAELANELNARKSGTQKGSGGNEATIINILDRNEIADAVARNPGAVVNALSRNLPQVRRMIMSGERP